MDTYFHSRYHCFLQQIRQYESLNDFLQIAPHNEKGESTHIDFTREQEKIYVTIKYKRVPTTKYNFKYLPDDVCNHIYDYLGEYIVLVFEIDYSKRCFPIVCPTWNLYHSRDNIGLLSKELSVNDYYKYIVQNHNTQNERLWSPATSIWSDILIFVTRVYPFEYTVSSV